MLASDCFRLIAHCAKRTVRNQPGVPNYQQLIANVVTRIARCAWNAANSEVTNSLDRTGTCELPLNARLVKNGYQLRATCLQPSGSSPYPVLHMMSPFPRLFTPILRLLKAGQLKQQTSRDCGAFAVPLLFDRSADPLSGPLAGGPFGARPGVTVSPPTSAGRTWLSRAHR